MRCGSVVDIGEIHPIVTIANDFQLSLADGFQQGRNQMIVARPPNQVGPQCAGLQITAMPQRPAIRGQDIVFTGSLGGGIAGIITAGKRQRFIATLDAAGTDHHAWRAGINQAGDIGGDAGLDHIGGAENIDVIELFWPPP